MYIKHIHICIHNLDTYICVCTCVRPIDERVTLENVHPSCRLRIFTSDFTVFICESSGWKF